MKINVTTTVEEIIEIEVPAYYFSQYGKKHGVNKITEEGKLYAGSGMISFEKTGSMFFNANVVTAIKGEPATEVDFMNAYKEALSVFNPLVNNAAVYAGDGEE